MGGSALASLLGMIAALGAMMGMGGGGSGSSSASASTPTTPGTPAAPASSSAPAALAVETPPAAPEVIEEPAPELIETPELPGALVVEEPEPEPDPEPVPDPDPEPDPAPAPGPAPTSSAPDLPGSAYDIGWEGLTAEEQLVVELVNRARLDPLAERGRQDPEEGFASGVTTSPKEALAVVETLSDAADNHNDDMDARNFFAHTNPDGATPADRAIAAGHENGFVGENIGWAGSTGAYGNLQTRAQNHHDALWDSDGHQRNFMNENWSEIGVGYDYGDHVYEGVNYTSSTFVTEKFSDTGKTYLTGVVIDDRDGDAFYDLGEGQGDVRVTAWNDDGVHATATWSSGGYTLELPPGTYNVAFEGGDLDGVYETTVTIGTENVKLDVIEDRDAVGGVLSSGPDGDGPVVEVLVSPAAPDSEPLSTAVEHLLSGDADAAALAQAEEGWADDEASDLETAA